MATGFGHSRPDTKYVSSVAGVKAYAVNEPELAAAMMR